MLSLSVFNFENIHILNLGAQGQEQHTGEMQVVPGGLVLVSWEVIHLGLDHSGHVLMLNVNECILCK